MFCTITLDSGPLKKFMTPELTLDERRYYKLRFDVILKFGLTELTAEISFNGNVSFMISAECMKSELMSTLGVGGGKAASSYVALLSWSC